MRMVTNPCCPMTAISLVLMMMAMMMWHSARLDHSVRRMRLFLIASHVGRVVPCGSMMRMRLMA